MASDQTYYYYYSSYFNCEVIERSTLSRRIRGSSLNAFLIIAVLTLSILFSSCISTEALNSRRNKWAFGVQLAAAQTPLLPSRSIAYFAICGSYSKSQAGAQCKSSDSNSWLATPATLPIADQQTAMKSALSSLSCSDCAWLNGSRVSTSPEVWKWAGGDVISSGWYPDQPANNPAEVMIVTNGGCDYPGSSTGWANELASEKFNAMCMKYPCSRSVDCSNKGDASGSYPGCICSNCDEGYGGTNCGTRICSKVFECNSQASAVSGTYPSCTCVCLKHYGGRSCRPLTATLLPTRSVSRTKSLHLTNSVQPLPTASPVMSETPSASRSQVVSGTRTLQFTDTTTSTISSTSSATVKFSPSISKAPTFSGSMSESKLVSPSRESISLSISFSNSISLSRTETASTSYSLTMSSTNSLSISWSASESASLSPSGTVSGSATEALTLSPSWSTSVSHSASATDYSMKPSQSFTASCYYDGFGLGAQNLSCVLLTAITDETSLGSLGSGYVPYSDATSINVTNTSTSNGDELYADGSSSSAACFDGSVGATDITYTHWTGRVGAVFVLAIRPSDKVFAYYNPKMVLPTLLVGNSDFTLLNATFFEASAVPETTTSDGGIGNAPYPPSSSTTPTPSTAPTTTDAAHRYIVMHISYNGRATLSKPAPFAVYLDTRTAFKCPLAGELTIRYQPAAAPKTTVLPDGLTEALSVLNALMMLPTAAVLLGSLTSIQSMSRCEAADLEEELDFMNNPLGLSFGNVGEGRYQRGVLVGAIAIYAGFSALLALMSLLHWALRRCIEKEEGTQRRRGRKPAVVVTPLPLWKELCAVVAIGFPSALLPISAFILDGVTNAAITLMVISPSAVDRVIGSFVFILIVGYIGHVAWVTFKCPQEAEYGNSPSNRNESDEKIHADPTRRGTIPKVIQAKGPTTADLDFDESDFYLGSSEMPTSLKSIDGAGLTPPLLPNATVVNHSTNSSFSLEGLMVATAGAPSIVRVSFDTNLSLVDVPNNPPSKKATKSLKAKDMSRKADRFSDDKARGPIAAIKRLARYLFTARCEWKGDAEWDTKYHHYIADCMPRLRTYRAIELTFGNFVSGLEALAYASVPVCMAKLGLALLALFALLVCVLVIKPIAVRSSIGFVSFTLLIQLVAGVMLVANVSLQSVEVEAGADYLFAVATIFVLLTSLVESAWFFIENSVVAKNALLRLLALRRLRRKGLLTELEDELIDEEETYVFEEPSLVSQEMSTVVEVPNPAPLNETDEARVVREILTDFQNHLLKESELSNTFY